MLRPAYAQPRSFAPEFLVFRSISSTRKFA